jgi:hypothetical protein
MIVARPAASGKVRNRELTVMTDALSSIPSNEPIRKNELSHERDQAELDRLPSGI